MLVTPTLLASIRPYSQLLRGVVLSFWVVGALCWLKQSHPSLQHIQVAYATNHSIGQTTTVSAQVPDFIAPSVPILVQPANHSIVTQNSPTFVWNRATDNVGVNHYKLYIDGNLALDSIPTTTTTGSNYQLTYNLSSQQYTLNNTSFNLSEGNHTWYIVAVDAANNQANSSTWSFTVDTIPPFFTVSTINSNTANISTTIPTSVPTIPIQLQSTTPILAGVGEANSAVVLKVEYSSKPNEYFAFSINSSGIWSALLSTLPTNEVIYLTFIITDQAGLINTLADIPIIITATPSVIDTIIGLTPLATITPTPIVIGSDSITLPPTADTTPPLPGSNEGVRGFVPPQQVRVELFAGETSFAFRLTSLGSKKFLLAGNPTSYGPGIDWSPKFGNIATGESRDIFITALSDVPPGIYTGTTTLTDSDTPSLEYPFSVEVVVKQRVFLDITQVITADQATPRVRPLMAPTRLEDVATYSTAVPIASLFAVQLILLLSTILQGLSPRALLEFGTLLELARILGIIPREKPYGIVFESITQEPAKYATVIFSGVTNQNMPFKTVKITNKHGMFGKPNLPDGIYRVSVEFRRHLFPTMIQRSQETPWDNFYKGEEFKVEKHSIPSLFIPIDLNPDSKDPELWKNILRGMEKKLISFNPLSTPFLVMNTILTIIHPSIFNATVFILHVSHFVYKSFLRKTPLLTGKIIMPDDTPLENVAMKVHDHQSEEVILVGQTGNDGSFAFWLEPGGYLVSVHLHEYMPVEKHAPTQQAENLTITIPDKNPIYETVIMNKVPSPASKHRIRAS